MVGGAKSHLYVSVVLVRTFSFSYSHSQFCQ